MNINSKYFYINVIVNNSEEYAYTTAILLNVEKDNYKTKKHFLQALFNASISGPYKYLYLDERCAKKLIRNNA